MPKILIADDSQFMRKMLKDILTKAGFTDLIEAGDGNEALDKYEEEKPDLVLLDIIMPDVDGLGVLKELGKADAVRKVIVVSAVGQEKMKEKAKDLGVRYYIVKPFQEKEVVEMVKKVLETLKKE